MPRPDYTLPLDQLSDPLPIEPLTKPFDVTITPPGSKSITCRAYVLAALAHGESKLIRPLRANDTDLLLKALCTLGAKARWEGDDLFIQGVGGRFPRGGTVNLGDGGTPTRFMIACACLAAEPVTVDGSMRMRERPIAEGVDMLRQLGAKIEYVEAEGRLPVRVTPSETFVGGRLDVPRTASSQFISAVLLVAPALRRGTQIRCLGPLTSETYIDLTASVVQDWHESMNEAVNVFDFNGVDNKRYDIDCTPVPAATLEIESDASSAVYWMVAAAITSGRLRVPGLPLLSHQPDARTLFVLRPQVFSELFPALGAIAFAEQAAEREWGWPIIDGDFEPQTQIDADDFPDGSLALAAGLASIRGTSRLTGLRTLRVKETDRIAALASELRKVGCEVVTGEDWIEITPPALAHRKRSHAVSDDQREEDTDRASTDTQSGSSSRWSSDPALTVIETYNDHRMAMAFAVLGLAAPNGQRLAIRNPTCVAKSYPTFWKDFAKLYQ